MSHVGEIPLRLQPPPPCKSRVATARLRLGDLARVLWNLARRVYRPVSDSVPLTMPPARARGASSRNPREPDASRGGRQWRPSLLRLGYVGEEIRPRLAHCRHRTRHRGGLLGVGDPNTDAAQVRSTPGATSTSRGHRPSGPRDFPQPRLVLTHLRDSCLVWWTRQDESRGSYSPPCPMAVMYLHRVCTPAEVRWEERTNTPATAGPAWSTSCRDARAGARRTSSLARATCRIGSGRRAHLARWLPGSGPSPLPGFGAG